MYGTYKVTRLMYHIFMLVALSMCYNASLYICVHRFSSVVETEDFHEGDCGCQSKHKYVANGFFFPGFLVFSLNVAAGSRATGTNICIASITCSSHSACNWHDYTFSHSYIIYCYPC